MNLFNGTEVRSTRANTLTIDFFKPEPVITQLNPEKVKLDTVVTSLQAILSTGQIAATNGMKWIHRL